MKKNHLSDKKIQSLEEKLKEKEKQLKKYQRALNDSNERIEQITKGLEESLSLVRNIHKNLLPVSLPQIPGFELSFKFQPAQQGVSGDFFDVIKIKDSMNFGVLLSSCNTYAITSLFLSSFLKFSADIEKYKTVKDFLSFTAKKILSSINQKEKIHLFYGIISRTSLEMDYCLIGDIFAGRKSKGKDFEILSPSSDSLYSGKDMNFEGQKLHLKPEDVLLISSPGVTQRKNNKGKSFGKENIVKSLGNISSSGVLEIRQKVLFSCNQFANNEPPSRDCTVLAIKTAKRVLKVHKSF